MKKLNIAEVVIPLLFSINCTSWTINLITKKSLILSIIVVSIINIVLFMFLNYIKNRKKQVAISYILLTVVLILGILILLSIDRGGSVYISWIKIAPYGEECNWYFYIVSAILFSYFFASVIFYFTIVIKRIIVLLLIGFIPLFIHIVRCEQGISFSFLMFIVLFLLVYIMVNLQKYILNKEISFKVIIMFLTIVMIITSVIPSPTFSNKVEDIIDDSYKVNNKKFNTSEAKKDTSIDVKSVPQSNKVLFEVESDEPLYIKVQSWDKYLNNKWCIGDKSLLKQEVIKDTDKLIPNIDDVAAAIEQYYDCDNEEAGRLKKYKVENSDIKKAKIYYRSYTGEYLLNVPGTFSIKIPGYNENIYKDGLSKYMIINEDINENMVYEINYVSQNIKDNSLQKQLLKYLNKERYYEIFHSIEGKDFLLEQGLYNGIKDSIKYRYKYTDLPDNIPKRIYDLAYEITKDKKSDYEKAVAIEKFFYNGEFKYDFNMEKAVDGQDYNDFFIFEGKKGVCVQFASAMVVLARASGLPARYVEGFVADEFDEESNRYVVREKDAHAFPEIYISGYGWMTFEPTVGNIDEDNVGVKYSIKKVFNNIYNFIVKLPIWCIILILLLTILIIILGVFLYKKFIEYLWRYRILKCNNDVIIKEVFKKIVIELEKLDIYFVNGDTYTSYGDKVFKERGIIIFSVVDILNRNQYRGVIPNDEEIDKIFKNYYQLRNIIKNRFKKLKI